jgi:hypothetical protein
METYLDIQLNCPASALPVVQKIASGGDELAESSLNVVMTSVGYRSAMALAAIFSDDYLAEYFEGLEDSEPDDHGMRLRYTCGPEGFSFGSLLLHALSSHCSSIQLEFDHDEDAPEEGDWPLRLQWDYGRQKIIDSVSGRALAVLHSLEFEEPVAVQGPRLTMSALEPLHQLISQSLQPANAKVNLLLEAFEKIVPLLTALEDEFQSGNGMSEDNSLEFQSLREQHLDFLCLPQFSPFFIADLRATLERMLKIHDLGSLIKVYDSMFYLCSGLVGFLNADGGESIIDAFKSLSDYDAWREHFLEQIEESAAE